MTPLPAGIVLSAATSAFCFGLSLVPVRNPLAVRLERFAGITERVTAKRLERIDAVLSQENRSKLRARLNAGGWYEISPATYVLRGFAGLTGGFALGLTLWLVMPNKSFALVCGILAAALGWYLPKIALDRAIAARRECIAGELPDFLDLLAATVRAGLALNGALVQASEALVGPLKEELRTTLAEIRLGRPRAEALQGMAKRIGDPQTATMVTTIVQAERLGANLSGVLNELAIDVRNRRWMLAEERAAQIPIKMIFPMALFMLPSLYIMLFTPLVARFFAR